MGWIVVCNMFELAIDGHSCDVSYKRLMVESYVKSTYFRLIVIQRFDSAEVRKMSIFSLLVKSRICCKILNS